MSRHLRVLAVFADGRPRNTTDLYRAVPYETYPGAVVKDLARDGHLVRVAEGWKLTEAGLARLSRSTPVGGRR